MWRVWREPNFKLRHAFNRCYASLPLLRWRFLLPMKAVIKNTFARSDKADWDRLISLFSHLKNKNSEHIKTKSLLKCILLEICKISKFTDNPWIYIKKNCLLYTCFLNFYLIPINVQDYSSLILVFFGKVVSQINWIWYNQASFAYLPKTKKLQILQENREDILNNSLQYTHYLNFSPILKM